MQSYAAFLYRFHLWIISFWIIVFIIAGYYAFQLPSVLQGSGFEKEGEFSKVNEILHEDFGAAKNNIIVLFEKDQEVSVEEWEGYISSTIVRLEAIEEVTSVTSPLEKIEQRTEHVAYAVMGMDVEIEEMRPIIPKIKEQIQAEPGMKVSLTGAAVVSEDMNEASQHDLARAEMIGLPIALVVLLFAFGGLVAAVIPLLIGAISVLTTMGILYFLGQELDLSIFVLNVVPMIGLALGIDFALLFINRFREELKKNSAQDSIMVAIQTAGKSIIFSGLCVFLGLAGMLVLEVDIFRTVSISGMAVIIVSVVCALTFLPSLLAVLGARINKLMIIKETKRQGTDKWRQFATFVMKRPITMSLLATAILLISVIPIKDLELTIPDARALPAYYESRQALETYETVFDMENRSEVIMIVSSPRDLENEKELKKLEAMIEAIEKDDFVEGVDSIFSASGNLTTDEITAMLKHPELKNNIQPLLDKMIQNNQTILTVHLKGKAFSNEAENWVRNWSNKETELDLKIGGLPKFNQEIFDEIYAKTPWALLFILFSTYVILLFAYRSVIIPFKAIIMNLLSLSATMGLLVWLFQGGYLGLEPTTIGLMIPVFIFGIVFGLSMDYEVFLISRIHEIYQETRDNDTATLEGLTTTSKIITSAAAIMIVVTGAFAFTGVVPVKQMGIGIALAIFIDATIVRMLLVPSLMKLMGNWNWWAPKWIRKER
jgi:RND superfamily putative drug exporter